MNPITGEVLRQLESEEQHLFLSQWKDMQLPIKLVEVITSAVEHGPLEHPYQ